MVNIGRHLQEPGDIPPLSQKPSISSNAMHLQKQNSKQTFLHYCCLGSLSLLSSFPERSQRRSLVPTFTLHPKAPQPVESVLSSQ